MSDLNFCPQCGAALVGAQPSFCASCGSRLPNVRSAHEPVGDAGNLTKEEGPSPAPDVFGREAPHQSDIPVWEGQVLDVGSDIPFGLYRTTVMGESYSGSGQSIQVVNGCGAFGYGLFLADERSATLEIADDGVLIPIRNLPSWNPLAMADDLIMGTCLIGADIAPGRYRIDPHSGQAHVGEAFRLDAMLDTLGSYGVDSPTSREPTVVNVEETDFALQFFGRPCLLG